MIGESETKDDIFSEQWIEELIENDEINPIEQGFIIGCIGD